MKFTPLVDGLPATVPFVGPENLERRMGRPFLARLGANENGFGPSKNAIAAMATAAAECWQYADPENHDLKAALAAHHGVAASNIIVGEGIDGLLGYLVRLMVEPGVEVVTSDGAYPTFNFHVQGYGGRLTKVPYRDDAEDPDALLAAARRVGARMIYFANPDNPMGSEHGPDVVAEMIANLPDGCLLILDEAYGEYSQAGLLPLDVADPRVIRFRTFSKAHGMAGARVGYGIGEAGLIGAFDKIRNHFGMSRVSVAGAMAALADGANLKSVLARTQSARERISAIARDHDLVTLPSATNFVTIDCGRDGDYARAVLAELGQRGVFIRMPGVAPMDRCIRVSVGPDAELDCLAEHLGPALAAAG